MLFFKFGMSFDTSAFFVFRFQEKPHTHDTQEDDSKVGGNQKGVRHPSASYWVGVAVTSLPTIAFRSREQRARLLLYNNTDN
jgi:hypothetical protein